MAIYDYECEVCGKEWEESRPMADYKKPAICPKCGGEGHKLIKSARIGGFKAMWFRDIDVEPIYVTSKRQLREECKKRATEFGEPVACQLL